MRRTYEGTHRGGSLLGIPATGKRFQFGGISIFRLANGRIAEHWEQLDRLALIQQLGLVPEPDAPSAPELQAGAAARAAEWVGGRESGSRST